MALPVVSGGLEWELCALGCGDGILGSNRGDVVNDTRAIVDPAPAASGSAAIGASEGFLGEFETVYRSNLVDTQLVPSVSSGGYYVASASSAGVYVPSASAAVSGGTQPKSLGPRSQVADTTQFPYRAIVDLNIRHGDGFQHRCSGFMIGDHTVATAGHCAFYPGHGWADQVWIFPGRNGVNAKPFGHCYSTRVHAPRGWYRSAKNSYDYGAVQIERCKDAQGRKATRDLGKRVGYIGLLAVSKECYRGPDQPCIRARMSGYPGGKGLTQWTGVGEVESTSNPRLQRYWIETYNGDSGSPLMGYGCNGHYCAIGIASHIEQDPQTLQLKYKSLKITSEVIEALESMKRS